jgi:hypothetical protein
MVKHGESQIKLFLDISLRFYTMLSLFYPFFSEILAQESRNVTVLLNTSAVSEESQSSTQK